MVIASRLLAATMVALCCGAAAATPSLIPLPAHMEGGEGRFALSSQTPLVCADPGDQGCTRILDYLAGLLQRDPGLTLRRDKEGNAPAIILRRTSDLTGEAYRLHVAPSGIEIAAGSDAGLFYGAVTAWQLSSQQPPSSGRIEIASIDIADAPRFSWRGVMLDSARHFQKPDAVKQLLDTMAMHKLNVLQWHLTDDQGWRIEIQKYPRLTKIGAWRKNNREGRYGGFYTQVQIRDIVAYAAARHITVVPEIEMPGHASAAIAAYPQLGSLKHPPRKVSGDWGVFPNLYNVDDTTFAFLEDVLTEVMTLFPSPYIHVGGDEAPKGQWDASPNVQKRMAALGVPDTKALQGYFTARMGRFLEAHGRRLIGWDEILEGGPPQSATITSWRTIESANEAAEKGHDVVLSPSPQLYLDHCQREREGEPTCRGGAITLRDIYAFDPVPSGALTQHLIGMQANIWTEHLPTADAVSYAAFPRLAAFAEIAWSPQNMHHWPDFVTRLPAQFARYNALGIVHSNAAFAVDVAAVPSSTGATVTLSSQTGFGAIHYTRDGSPPMLTSPVFDKPFETALPAVITGATFDSDRVISAPARERLNAASLLRRNSYTLEQCAKDILLAQRGKSGAVMMVNVMNPCWLYRGLDMTAIRGFDIAITTLPFNFQIGADIQKIPLDPKASRFGQLEIHDGDCKGERLAVVSLSPKSAYLHIPMKPRAGLHDLCFAFARRKVDPLWAVDWVQPLAKE